MQCMCIGMSSVCLKYLLLRTWSPIYKIFFTVYDTVTLSLSYNRLMIVTYNVLTFLLGIYTVSQKRPPFYFLNNSVTTLPLLMIFGVLNLRKFYIKILQICPPHVSDVATLPWEIQKKSFSAVSFIRTSDYLRYLKKQTVITCPHHLKMSLH